nr:polyprotein [Potyvirus sp.]
MAAFGSTIDNQARMSLPHHLRGVKFTFKTEVEAENFMRSNRTAFLNKMDIPNGLYDRVMVATRNHLSVILDHDDFRCTECTASGTLAQMKAHKEKHAVKPKQNNVVLFGKVVTEIDDNGKSKFICFEPDHDQVILVRGDNKKTRRIRSKEKFEWIRKWPEGEIEVSTIQIADELRDVHVVDLLADERDIHEEEKVEQTVVRKWFGLRKTVVTQPKIHVKANLNELIRQTLDVAIANKLPIEYIDKRVKFSKKAHPTLLSVPVCHAYDPELGCKDDINDDVLRNILNHAQFEKLISNEMNCRFNSKALQPGWSGVVLTSRMVEDQDQFEFSSNGICVVKGRGTNGKILNALWAHDSTEIAEFYSLNIELAPVRAYDEQLTLDHKADNARFTANTYAIFANAFFPDRHIWCDRCSEEVIGSVEQAMSLNSIDKSILALQGSVAKTKRSEHLCRVLERLRGMIASSTINRQLRTFSNPQLNSIIASLDSHGFALRNILNTMNRLAVEIQEQEHKQTILDCGSQLAQNMADHQRKLENEMDALEHMIRVREAHETSIYNGVTPKLYLDILRDNDGNSSHHGTRGVVPRLLSTKGVSEVIHLSKLGVEIRRWDMLGPVYARFWSCASLWTQGENANAVRFLQSCSQINQHTEHCSMSVMGAPKVGCKTYVGKVALTPSVMPLMERLRFGDLNYPQTMNFPFKNGLFMTIINNGYCYLHVFLMMAQFVQDDELAAFVQAVRAAITDLGAWPRFAELTGRIFRLCLQFPDVCEAPFPVLLVDHTRSIAHFVGQVGVGDYGWHQVNINSVQELYDMAPHIMSTPIMEYRVGGLQTDLKRAFSSSHNFLNFLKSEPQLLIDALVHPSAVHGIYILSMKYNIINNLLDEDEHLVSLIARINTLGAQYNIFLEAEEVVKAFCANNITFCEPLREAFGPEISAAFLRQMNVLINQQLDRTMMDSLERVVEKNLDLVQRETDMRVTIKEYLRASISFFDYMRLRLSVWSDGYRLRIGGKMITCAEDCTLRLKHVIRVAQENCIKRPVRWATMKTSMWCASRFAEAIMPYYMIASFVMIIASCVIMLVRAAQSLCRRRGYSHSYEARAKTGKFASQCMAIAAIITAFFNTDLSDQWFSCMTKFKALMNTLFDEYSVYEAGNEELSIDPVGVITFVLNADEKPKIPVQTTFASWRQAREQSGNLGSQPRSQGVHLHLAKNNIASVARKILDSDSNEFLVIGRVGCGKSTKFVAELATTGKVLLCEPTRALVTNVEEGHQTVCGTDPSVRMRMYNKRGSSPITIMTYGFALEWFANGCEDIGDYAYVVFDECHIVQEDTVVFYNWLKSREPLFKLIKASATPFGMNTKYEPECPVNVIESKRVSLSEFVSAQGTGALLDATKYGDSALVFVASYNEVDTLTDMLRKKNYGVLKADGRTLRNTPNLSKRLSEINAPKKFVVATNAIENGVTLDIDVVIDFGEKIVGHLDSDSRMIKTRRVNISAGERIQRLGRVGRYKPGTAIRIGSLVECNEELTSLVATGAALKSFAHNVPPCLINVDLALIDSVTRDQVKVASIFELDAVYMAHFVRPDGRVPRAVFNEFNHLLLRDAVIHTTDKFHCNIASQSWRTCRAYMNGDSSAPLVPVPFHAYSISDEALLRIAEAVKVSDPGRGAGICLPADKLDECVYKLTYDQDRVVGILQAIENLKEREMTKLDSLRSSTAILSSQSLLNVLNLRFLANKSRLESQYRKNLETLNQVEQVLRSIPKPERGDAAILEYMRENPQVAHCVLYEGDIGAEIDTNILGRKSFQPSKFVLPITIFLIIACIYYVYTLVMSTQEEAEMEASKRKKWYRREKGGAWEFMTGDGTDFEERFGEAYTKRRERKNPKKVKPEGAKLHKFQNFYDLDIEAFDLVKFVDPKTKVVLEVPTHNLDMNLVADEMREANAEATRFWDEKPTELHAYFLREGDKDGYMVTMKPHNSKRVSLKNTSLPVGFPERQDELRQEGPVMRCPASKIKELEEGSSFESLTTINGPRDYEHLKGYVVRLGNGLMTINGFGFGQYICTNLHFMGTEDVNGSKTDLIVQSRFGVQNYKCAQKIGCHPIKEHDLCLIPVAFDAPRFRNKLRMRKPVQGENILMVTPKYTEIGMQLLISDTSVTFNKPEFGTYWRHFITTTRGLCGSLLIATSDGCVVGLHGLGGGDKVGWNYFTPICDELIQELNKPVSQGSCYSFSDDMINRGSIVLKRSASIFPTVRKIIDLATYQSGNFGDKFCGGNIVKVGEIARQTSLKHVIRGVRREYLKFLELNSQHQWALMYLNNRLPSVLSLESFYKDFLKYDEPVIVGMIDKQCAETAFTRVVRILERAGFTKGSIQYVWDPKEIVKDMNLDAAMGAMYFGKKKDWFRGLTDEELIEAHHASLLQLLKGECGVWSGSLKAELRPAEKVLEGKTRVFTAAPVDVLMGAKTLVDNFNKEFYDRHLDGPWTVGINKFNRGWDRLARSFDHTLQFIDADGSRFDSSLSPYLFDVVKRLRKLFMEEDEWGSMLLDQLYTQIVYTPITTIDGNIVRKHKGNNSGQPSTVVDNTLILIFVMEYARCKYPEVDADNTFKYVANGDDLLINGSAASLDVVANKFAEAFTHCGLQYNFQERHKSITTVEYMSHSFVLHQGIYIPKLSVGRVLSIAEWERNEEIGAQLSALNAARIEAWGHADAYKLLDEFIHYFAQQKHLSSYFYIPSELIEKLYLNTEEEVEAYIDQVFTHEYQADERPQPETVPGFEPPPENETETQRQTRENRNRERYEAALRDWEARQAGASTSGDVPTGDAVDATMVLPQLKARELWIPPSVKSRLTPSVVKQLLNYNPDQMLMRADVAPQESVSEWIEKVKADLGVNDVEIMTIIQAFMVWCINSGTSKESISQEFWQADDGRGNVMQYPLKPFVVNAGVSLRSIMRNLSPIAEAWIKERNRKGTWISAWALRAGLSDKRYAHVGFDFWVASNASPHNDLHYHALMTQAHLKGVPIQSLAMANIARNNGGVPDYHVSEDVAPGRHNYNGARLP